MRTQRSWRKTTRRFSTVLWQNYYFWASEPAQTFLQTSLSWRSACANWMKTTTRNLHVRWNTSRRLRDSCWPSNTMALGIWSGGLMRHLTPTTIYGVTPEVCCHSVREKYTQRQLNKNWTRRNQWKRSRLELTTSWTRLSVPVIFLIPGLHGEWECGVPG